jgi:hypothetical protein
MPNKLAKFGFGHMKLTAAFGIFTETPVDVIVQAFRIVCRKDMLAPNSSVSSLISG